MPLRSLTNSPGRPSQLHRKTQLSSISDFPLSSPSSGLSPSLSADDGIYNAQRVKSDQVLSILDGRTLGPVYQLSHDRVTDADLGLRRRKALSEGDGAATEHSPIHHSSVEIKPEGHCRGWSLNDLDCATHIQILLRNAILRRSPSSNEALEAAANVTVYPHLPSGPPPCRKSTPDGLPSFGTREAQELRLVPPSRLYRLTQLIQRQFQPPVPAGNVTHSAVSAQDLEQPRYLAPDRTRFEGPTEALRRVSRMIRPVYVTAGPRKIHRSALPKGVRMASAPGNLTVAEDGSHVRGRFGARVSGHGIGQRTLDLHPLVRGQESSAIEDEVRAINKACDRENLREQYQSSSITTEYRTITRTENDYLHTTARVQAEITEASAVAQAIQNERRAVHALKQQRRQIAELRAALKARHPTFIAPSVTPDSSPATHPSQSHDSSNTIYHSAQVSRNASNIRSSEGDTIRPPRTTEPASYGVRHLRSTTGQDSMLVGPAIEEMLERQEPDQAFQEAHQRSNGKSETGVC